jgi:hypothetical protein
MSASVTLVARHLFGKALAAAVALAAGLVVSACGERSTPEQQVRAVIEAAEDAAERRDHGDLMALLSPRFEGAHGEDAREVSRLLRAYLVANPSLEVVSRIETIDFPYRDMARVELTVGTLGRGGQGALDLDADAKSFELELQREGDDWHVTRAEWD